MEKLADEAGQAINDRDKAWREISRVRQLLELDLGQEQDSLDEFRVSTHFVPKGLSVIPTTLPLSQEGAAAGLQLRRHHGSELDESQLDAVDQLVRQEMRHKQGQHGGGRPARSIDDEMAGGMSMGPYSRQAGPPSLIPKPPGAMGADEPVPKSRYSSFFNLEGAAAAAAVASMSAHKAQGSVLRRGGGGMTWPSCVRITAPNGTGIEIGSIVPPPCLPPCTARPASPVRERGRSLAGCGLWCARGERQGIRMTGQTNLQSW